MSVTVSESYLSRPATVGRTQQRELIFDAFCAPTDTEQDVIEAIDAIAPPAYQGLIIEDINVEPVTDTIWKGHVLYKRREDENEYTFDTTGGTQKITQSYGTTSYSGILGGAPDFNGAIGVTEDKVEGVDITVPAYQFSETHLIADSTVVSAYKLNIFNATGKVNNAPFKDLDTGEVLFLGASGSRRGDTQWSITFRFVASPNVTGLTIGSITGVAKGGWEYMWVRYADFADNFNFQLVKRPIAVYVEQVYLPFDFSTLGIGT